MADKITDIVFCPNVGDTQIAFMNLLPRGRAWGTREALTTDSGTVIQKFFKALSVSWTKFEDAMCQSFNEWYCFTSIFDKDLWNLDYGIPDECDLYNLDVCSKTSAIHTVDPEEILAVLAKSGYQAEARWLTGNDPEFPGVRSTLRMTVDPRLSPSVQRKMKLPFPLGAGRKLGESDLTKIQCMLDRYLPLHCVADVVTSGEFQPTDLGAKLLAWWSADDVPNGAVTSWVDRISGINLVPINVNNPVAAEDATGKRFVTFNGVNQALYSSAGVSAPGSDPRSFVILTRYDGVAGDPNMRLASIGTPSGTNPRMVRRLTGNSVEVSAQGISASTTHFLDPSGPYSNLVGYIRVEGATIRALGKEWTTSAPIPGLNTTGSTVVVGADSHTGSPTEWYKGGHRHIMVCQNLTSNDGMRLEAWCAWDINKQVTLLPPTHPYANMRP